MTFASEGRGGCRASNAGSAGSPGGSVDGVAGSWGKKFRVSSFSPAWPEIQAAKHSGCRRILRLQHRQKRAGSVEGGAVNALGQRRAQAHWLEGTGWASYQRGLQGEGAQDTGTTTGP